MAGTPFKRFLPKFQGSYEKSPRRIILGEFSYDIYVLKSIFLRSLKLYKNSLRRIILGEPSYDIYNPKIILLRSIGSYEL